MICPWLQQNGNKIATSFAAQMSHIVAKREGQEPAETTTRPGHGHGHNYRQRQLPAGNLPALTPIAHTHTPTFITSSVPVQEPLENWKTAAKEQRTQKWTEAIPPSSLGCINLLWPRWDCKRDLEKHLDAVYVMPPGASIAALLFQLRLHHHH